MEKQLIVNLYNPANFTRQELIERFIVRIAQFRRLYNDLASSLMDKPEQQYLLLARRGMGKTTMLLRLAYEMKQDAAVNAWMTPVVFHEEEYRIDELELLWERVAESMEEYDPMAFGGLKQQMADLHPALKDQPALFEEQAFDLLLARLRQHGKKLVLFIDNFGDIYQRFKRWELQRLRTVLQTTPDLRIVGATAIVLNDMYDAAHPFYEFFKVVKLEGLNAADTRTLLLALAERQQDERVAEIVRRQPQRVEVMRRLTGGVIRTVILLYEVFAEQREGKALRDLEIIADRTTPLYQDRMKELSDQQKKIVDAVARAWDGVTAGEIATATRLSAKHVSSQLQVLTGNGTIEQRLVAGSRQRVYLISERFFNIWYLMRFGRSDQRVLWLTRFLEAWCENAGELADRARRHLTALKDGGYDPKSAYLLSSALARALEFTEKALASAPDNAMVAHTAATVFLWADHTDRAAALAPRFLYDADFLDTNETDVVNFLLLCLAKAQYAFVEEAFTGPAGQSVQLQDRLKPVWYTLAYLRREEDPLTYARMGSEVEDTVKEMVAKAQAYQEKYKVNIR